MIELKVKSWGCRERWKVEANRLFYGTPKNRVSSLYGRRNRWKRWRNLSNIKKLVNVRTWIKVQAYLTQGSSARNNFYSQGTLTLVMPRDVLIVTTQGWGVLPASSRQRSGLLLNTLRYTDESPHNNESILWKISTLLRLGSLDSKPGKSWSKPFRST